MKGTYYDNRASMIIALICIRVNSILKKEAENLVDRKRGKWIDLTKGENYTYEFVKLVLSVPACLTDEEKILYKSY